MSETEIQSAPSETPVDGASSEQVVVHDITPKETLYINNLNEKIKVEGWLLFPLSAGDHALI
jgi:hypothetical protein